MRGLVLAAALLVGPGAAADPLTLQQAVQEALDRNPRLVAASAAVDAAQARSAQARAAWLPRLDASAASGESSNPVLVFGSLLEQGRFGAEHFDPSFLNDPGPLRNDRVTVNVRYTLFDQLRRVGATAQARNAVRQARHSFEESRQRIRLEALRSYSALVLAGQQRDVAAAAVRAAEAETAAIRDRLAQGLVVESDLLSAEVHLARYRQQHVEAVGELAIAGAALATLLQRPIGTSIEPVSTLRADAPLPVSLDDAIARGLAVRGNVKAAQLTETNARVALRSARGSLLPRLDAYGSWASSGSTFTVGNSNHTWGVVASLDLFDPEKLARVAEARASQTVASAESEAAEDAVAMEIVTAFHRLRAAGQRVDLASRSAEQAAAAARIVRDRYASGLTTITEQLRADTAVVAAQLDLLAARYDQVIGRAEMLRAMGELHDVASFE